MPVRRHQSVTMGMSIATMGVLFKNALSAATGSISRACAAGSDLGRPSTGRVTIAIAPVCRSPSAITNSTPMVTTPLRILPVPIQMMPAMVTEVSPSITE